MEDSIELTVESVSINDLCSLPKVSEDEWKKMTDVLNGLNLAEFKYKKPVPWQGKKFPARVTRIYDADTINVVFVNENGTPVMFSIRLRLIDAPEVKLKKGVSKLHRATGLSVTNYVSKLIPVGSIVTVAVEKHCIYNNRVIGDIFFEIDGVQTDLSVHLLQKELVKSYTGEHKREPWSDEELFEILRRIPEYQTEEAKSFIAYGMNPQVVTHGASSSSSVEPSSVSLVVPVLSESNSEGKKKKREYKNRQPHTFPNQGGATVIVPQNWFQAQTQGPSSQPMYSQGMPVFMSYMAPPPPPHSYYGRGRGGYNRGRGRS